MPTLTKQIGTGYADAYERTDNGQLTVLTGSWVYITSTGDYGFFRFIGIDIPQGATINSATVTFDKWNPSGAADTRIYAEKSVMPVALTSSDVGTTAISTRPLTGNYVDWSISGTSFYAPSTSPDFKTVIQEIVNQESWQSGNPIHLILVGQGGGRLGVGSYELDQSKSAILEINYTEHVAGLAAQGKNKQKTFLYKIYDTDGTYLTTWSKEVLNVPDFVWAINGGMGDLNIQLKRELKDFGEADDVGFGNLIQCYIQDGDQERGRKIWEGRINRYEPETTKDGTELVNVIATSRMLEVEKRLIKNGSATQKAFNSVDPSDIFRSLISMPSAGGVLKEGLVSDTGTTVTYTFNANTIREGFDICVKLAPLYWYFWLNADSEMNFKVANFNEVDHTLFVGREISNVRMTKSIENLCNRVYFIGGGSPNLYKLYERTSSQTEYGIREITMKDERVTVAATASLLANSFLNNYDHPIAEIELEVLDSNIDPKDGYDIERFKPGDIVQIRHPKMQSQTTLWDVAYWDIDWWDYNVQYSIGQPLQIVEVHYQFDRCILKLNQKLEDFQKRVEDIDRNLNTTAKVNLPSTPS